MTPIRLVRWHAEVSEAPRTDLDARLPSPNSLRRASEDSRTAVYAASQVLPAVPPDARERLGVYIGQQRGSLEYCTSFIDSTYKESPRLASPLYFSESVANNAATHLSLTLGFRGVMATFIGTRVAGIQALCAARDDLETGATDAGLVVVQSFPSPLTSDAYNSVYRPYSRSSPPAALRTSRGSLSLVLRAGPDDGASLRYASVRCFGRRTEDQVAAVRSLWQEFRSAHPGPAGVRASTFCLAQRPGLSVIRQALGPDAGSLVEPADRPECFALDPFLLAFDGPTVPLRAVVCLSEEGTAGLLAIASSQEQGARSQG